MAKEQLLRKRQRDLDKVCTTFRVDQPSYRFTLETCDNLTGIILDSRGNRVATFDAENSAVVSKVATYNVCIEGEGTGVAYTEWMESGDTACCDELRRKITELETLLNSIIDGSTETGCCEELRTEITNLDERVTILEQGGGATPECCERLSTEIESLKVRIAALEGKAFIATYNVTTAQEINEYLSSTNEPFAPILVKRDGSYYTVVTAAKQSENRVIIRTFATLSGEFYMFTYTITDGVWTSSSYGFQGKLTAGDNITINNNVISATGGGGLPGDFAITGGTNVQVVKSGNAYTISATDTNTQTTLVEGANVTITDSGTGGNHVYTIAASGSGGGGLPADFNIVGGDNVQVAKSGNVYTVSATDTKPDVTKQYVDDAIAGVPTTTLVEGANVTITDSGTGGNHVYTISATGGGGDGETVLWSGSVTTDVARTFTLSEADTDFDEVLIVGYGIFGGAATNLAAPNVLAIYRPALMTQGGDYIPLNALCVTKGSSSSSISTYGSYASALKRTNATTLTYTVTDSNIPVTITKIIGRKYYPVTGGLPSDFTITGGTNVSVAKSGNTYTISATDADTQTTLLPGTGVTITDGGTGGNHIYTITATGGSGEEIDIQSTSPNLTVTVETI